MPNYTQQVATDTVTIANGQSLSAALFIGGNRVVAIEMPAAWTAAGLSFQASADGVTYNDVHTTSAELTVTAGASRLLLLGRALEGTVFLKVRSGTSGTPVAQGADRVLKLIVAPLGM